MTAAPFDVAKAHRWFAVECNNRAWGLIEQPARTDDETEKMIHLAHASLHHWSEIGGDLQRLRALCLVATAYVVAGRAGEAVREAVRCAAMSDAMPMPEDEAPGAGVQSAFDRASAHGCAAAALELAGAVSPAAGHRLTEREWAVRCEPEERALVEKLYGLPG